MKLFKQILLRLIFWPMIFIGIVFAVFNITLRLTLDDTTLKTIVVYEIEQFLGVRANISWAKIMYNGEIRIKNLRLQDPDKLNESFITSEYVLAKVSPISLFTKQINISEIRFIAPQIKLTKESNSSWNIKRIISQHKKNPNSSGNLIEIITTQIRDGEIFVTDSLTGKQNDFKNVDLSLKQFTLNGDTPFETSGKFKINDSQNQPEGRFFGKGLLNLENFNLENAEIKELNGNIVLQDINIPFNGNIKNFIKPNITLFSKNPALKSQQLNFLFQSTTEFNIPEQDWNVNLNFLSTSTLSLLIKTEPLGIKAEGAYNFTDSTSTYALNIQTPPITLEEVNRYLPIPVANPMGKIKPDITVAASKTGAPTLTNFTVDFTNTGFKYKKLTVTALDMLLNLTENFENSNITVYDGRLQLGNALLTTLVMNGSLSKKELAVNFSGRLNSDNTKGKMAILNPFSKIKTVYYTGYSENLNYTPTKTLIFDLVDLLKNGDLKKNQELSAMPWLNTLKNSIPSGYSLFNIVYKTDNFKHSYIQAKDFYITATVNSLSGKIENMRGKFSIKTNNGILFNVEENSKNDRIHYLASMPLRFIDELNKKKAFKFEKLGDVNFNAMGGDIIIDKGIANIENFYMEGSEFSACLNGEVDFINETINLKIYTIMDRYNRGVLPSALTDASGKSAMAFSLSGKMNNPTLNMLSPKDTSKRITDAVLKEPSINFGKINRLLGGN